MVCDLCRYRSVAFKEMEEMLDCEVELTVKSAVASFIWLEVPRKERERAPLTVNTLLQDSSHTLV